MKLFDWLVNIDHELFTFLNGLNSSWMDFIQFWISDKYIWIPFYILLLVGVICHYRRKSILIVVMVAALVTLSDQSSQVFKYGVGRYRPCRGESMHQPKPHLVKNHCGGKYSFYSAHASNSFAIALFLGFLLTPVVKRSKSILIFWAAIVAYSRIYLGVHYPSDILVGTFFGITYGWLFWKLFQFIEIKYLNPKE